LRLDLLDLGLAGGLTVTVTQPAKLSMAATAFADGWRPQGSIAKAKAV
jgi:hypothetical protein